MQILRGQIVIRLMLLVCSVLFFRYPSHGQVTTKWTAPAEAVDQKNPVENNAASLLGAHKLYTSMCAPCHGYKGLGDGPVASTLSTRPADHSSNEIQSETDGSLFWKITNGRGPMQSYKTQLTDNQRWSIVNYIRTLKKS